MSNPYLEQYERHMGSPGYGGPAGWLRRLLDRRAARMGQRDRHALFLHRVLALAGLSGAEGAVRVLEVGCGSGWALTYEAPGVRYAAVDLGDRFAAALRARGIDFHIADAGREPLPFAAGAFDLVLLNHIIEHIADYGHLMSELARVTAPGGMLYVRTPDIGRVGAVFYDDYTHVKPYTRRSLRELMAAHGFDERCCYRSDHPRINLDILTGGRLRGLLLGPLLGGKEIEALYCKRPGAGMPPGSGAR